jgi:hypothetical protein
MVATVKGRDGDGRIFVDHCATHAGWADKYVADWLDSPAPDMRGTDKIHVEPADTAGGR